LTARNRRESYDAPATNGIDCWGIRVYLGWYSDLYPDTHPESPEKEMIDQLDADDEKIEHLLSMARQVNDEFEKIHTGMSEIFARALASKDE
jgi:hypothetical protein